MLLMLDLASVEVLNGKRDMQHLGLAPMDDLQIGDWVHPVLHVHHIRILKGSAHMEDAVHCCNV